MDLKLKDKVALVTGTASQIGYGKAIALTLAEEGCDVISADIDLEGAKKTAAEIEKLGRKAMAVKVDVSNRSDVDKMVKAVIAQFGRIDILINNAGTSSVVQPFMQMTKADWDLDIGVNLYGQMNMAQAVIPHMANRKYGRIVNCSGGQGIPGISVYGAAKGGVEQFTHALALEVAPMGIIVNAVLPGLGETGLVGTAPKEMLESMKQMSALKRLCTPQDVATMTAFLASDVCSYMVGQVVKLQTF
ncbi:MAG TPA: SDR family oxidoreductase [Dehalococcoidia bacterium]|nr:SDR family oxidoreductase [Dehalococcoidia bacterium]